VVCSKLVLFAQLPASQQEKKGQPNHCQFLRLFYGQLASAIFFYFCDVRCRSTASVSITWQSWQGETNSFGFVPSKREHKETNNKSEPNISHSTVPNLSFRQILCGLAVDSDV